jgi:recombinational DNA repair protein RecT
VSRAHQFALEDPAAPKKMEKKKKKKNQKSQRGTWATHFDDGKLGTIHRPVKRGATVAARSIDINARPVDRQGKKLALRKQRTSVWNFGPT